MRHIIALLALVTCLVVPSAFADYPLPTGMVTDIAGLLPPDMSAKLEATLRIYRDSTSIEIAVLIVPSLQGQEPNDYAQGIWKRWRIGKQGQDNGVLLLVVPPPEKKAWIATGYGIQGWLTDVDCKHIIAKAMHPLNQQEKRAEAVVAGVQAIMEKLGDTPWAQRPTTPKEKKVDPTTSLALWLLVFLILLIVVVFFLAWIDARRRNRGGGYSSGGSGGGWFSGGDSGGSSFDGFGGGDSGGGGGGGDD